MSSQKFLTAAVHIADELIQTAVRTPDGTTWNTDEILDGPVNFQVVRRPAAPDLYGGTAGIAWFLGHLAAVTSRRDLKATAVDAVRFAVRATQSGIGPESLSLFSGASGMALVAFDLGVALRQPRLRRQGVELARQVATIISSPAVSADQPDLTAGLAGVAIALVSMHRRTREHAFLKAADAACARLIRNRHQDGFGTSWPQRSGDVGRPALCGLAHGNSGIVWALAETAWAHRNRRFSGVIEDGLRYERSWFSSERCNWPDFRTSSAADQGTSAVGWTTAWCHGALGIGAVRLRIYEKTRSTGALAEATAAIQAARVFVASAAQALRDGQATDVTICHGLGGAVELMLLAYEITGENDHLRAARRTGDLCLSIFEVNDHRWTLGLRDASVVPGLFVGLAGIGTVMMRLEDPRMVASPALFGR